MCPEMAALYGYNNVRDQRLSAVPSNYISIRGPNSGTDEILGQQQTFSCGWVVI